MSADSWQWKKSLYESIWNIYPPVAIPLGLAFNCCAFLVLLQQRMRGMVVHLPITVLSIIDSLVLTVGLSRHWLRKASYFADNFGNQLDPQSLCDFCCKFLELILYLSLMYSSWIVMIIAVERYVAICVNPGSKLRNFFMSKRGLTLTLLTALLLLLGVNAHFLATRSLMPTGPDNITKCANLDEFKFFVEQVFPRIDLSLTAFVPFIVIAICNLRIIRRLRSVRRSSVLSDSKIGSYRTTVMLLVITFVFVLLTSPVKVYLTIFGSPYPEGINEYASPDVYYTHRVVWSLLLTLQFANHCCNFLLYCASNPLFRIEASRVFHRCACRRRCFRPPNIDVRVESTSPTADEASSDGHKVVETQTSL